MYTHEELESIPEETVKIFRAVELRILDDIVRRIALTGEITSTADYQIQVLSKMGVDINDIKKYIQSQLIISNIQLENMIKEVIESGYVRDKALYDASNIEFIPFEDNLELQQIMTAVIETSKENLNNLTKTLGFVINRNPITLTEYYQRNLTEATMQIVSGGMSYDQVLEKTVNELVNSGIRVIDYESGYHNRLEVAVRRAILGGVNRITEHISNENMKKLNTEYAEVSYHLTARPTHQVWQGRVYTKEELVTVCGLGTVTGLMGVNCYHHYGAFIPGISKRMYTDEELDKMNEEANTPKSSRVYGGKEFTKYEATQQQRKLENNIRLLRYKIDLLQKGNADKEKIITYKARHTRFMNDYKFFSKEMGLKYQSNRINLSALKK